MTERTIGPTQRQRTATVVEMEAKALATLIERRHEWLNNPYNRLRSTYTTVRRDTEEMIQQLGELSEELNNLLKTEQLLMDKNTKTMCAVRPDLADCGLAIPVGDDYITDGHYSYFEYRWLDDDIFQVFFNGEWRNAYSTDFVFITAEN